LPQPRACCVDGIAGDGPSVCLAVHRAGRTLIQAVRGRASVPSTRRMFSGPAPRSPYDALCRDAAAFIPQERLITDPLRLLAWGTDASFYRLVPAIAVVVESEDEVRRLLKACARHRTPVTFRAAGTSLSGQAITDSVLVMLGDNWRNCDIDAEAETVALGPGLIGAE